MYDLVTYIFTMLFTQFHHLYLVPDILLLLEDTSYPLRSHYLLTISMELSIADSVYKLSHTVYDLL